MTDGTELMYRLPLTYVRVVGSCRESHDTLVDERAKEREAVVTTEVGADLDTRCLLRLTVADVASAATTWNLTPDGRLTGADVTSTVDRYARWAPLLKVGLAGAAIAMPFLLPGPAGPLAALAAITARGRLSLADDMSKPDDGSDGEDKQAQQRTLTPDELRLQRYERDRPHDHQVLVGLIQALQAQELALVHAAITGPGAALTGRQKTLDVLRSEVMRAEIRYTAWLDGYKQYTSLPYDERVPVYQLPTAAMLKRWAEDGTESTERETTAWRVVQQMAEVVGTAVSVDLLERRGGHSQVADAGQDFAPSSDSASVWWRRPRLATVTTWRVRNTKDDVEAHVRGRRELTLVQSQRLLLAYPGNEQCLVLRPSDRESSAVSATFDESGAITQIVSSRTGAAVQRSSDVTTLLAGVKDSIAVGVEARAALAPPTLKEQAEAAEAWTKLHPAPADPEVKAMEARIAEEERKARLRLAEQLGTASSPPVLVRVDHS